MLSINAQQNQLNKLATKFKKSKKMHKYFSDFEDIFFYSLMQLKFFLWGFKKSLMSKHSHDFANLLLPATYHFVKKKQLLPAQKTSKNGYFL